MVGLTAHEAPSFFFTTVSFAVYRQSKALVTGEGCHVVGITNFCVKGVLGNRMVAEM
jgi:hypothetical protein